MWCSCSRGLLAWFVPSEEEEGVAEEARVAAISPAPEGVAARISGLVKVYRKGWWSCRGQDVRAVDNLSLTVREGEVRGSRTPSLGLRELRFTMCVLRFWHCLGTMALGRPPR